MEAVAATPVNSAISTAEPIVVAVLVGIVLFDFLMRK